MIDPQEAACLQDRMYESPHYNYRGSTEWAALLRSTKGQYQRPLV